MKDDFDLDLETYDCDTEELDAWLKTMVSTVAGMCESVEHDELADFTID